MSALPSPVDQELNSDVARRTKELRSALGRSSTRRIIYLAAALQRIIEPYSHKQFPEAWDALNDMTGRFSQLDIAMGVFDAEEVDGDTIAWR